jgi:DNA transposition AAA+ family ATPase
MPISGDPDWVHRLTEESRILGEARMLRDDQELTPELSRQVIERFSAYLKRVEKSMAWAARSLDIAESTLSQILSGNYAADPEKQIRKIDKWLESQILKENAPRPAGFVKNINVAKQIYGAARWAIETNGIVLVHGPAGIGKTITAMAVRAETPGSVFVSIKTAGQSKLSVLESIAQAMRLPNIKMTSWQLFQQIEMALKDTGRLLIVDEIHKLVGRRKDEALHCLRDLHDATGIPMLWLGVSSIATYIQTGQAQNYEPLDQLYSRIGLWLNLTELANQSGGGDGGGSGLYSIEDIQKILTAGKLRITPDAARFLQILANTPGAGALRTVSKLLQLAQRHAARSNAPIDAQMLRDIQGSRLGLHAAVALEERMNLQAQKVA